MQLAEADRQLTGRVKIDDALQGSERTACTLGHDSENKVPFVAAEQTTEVGLQHLECLAALPFTKNATEDLMITHTVLPMTLVSDGLSCFTAARALGALYDHEITDGGKASATNTNFRAVNTLLGKINTAFSGTCHTAKFAKYAYRYPAKVPFQVNRRYDLHSTLGSLLGALDGTAARPERGIRVTELHANRVLVWRVVRVHLARESIQPRLRSAPPSQPVARPCGLSLTAGLKS